MEFFLDYGPSALPRFVPIAGVNLNLGFLPMSPACGVILLDSRDHRLLLPELPCDGLATECKLLVCNPLEKTFERLPPFPVAGHTVACSTIVPCQGAKFRVVIVLLGDLPGGVHGGAS